MTDPDYLVYLACWMCWHEQELANFRLIEIWARPHTRGWKKLISMHTNLANYYRGLINDHAG